MTPRKYLKTDLDEEVDNYRDWGFRGAKIQSIEASGL